MKGRQEQDSVRREENCDADMGSHRRLPSSNSAEASSNVTYSSVGGVGGGRRRSQSLEELWQWSATGERFPRPAKFKESDDELEN